MSLIIIKGDGSKTKKFNRKLASLNVLMKNQASMCSWKCVRVYTRECHVLMFYMVYH